MELRSPSPNVPDWVQESWERSYRESIPDICLIYPTLADWLQKCNNDYVDLSIIERTNSLGICLETLKT
jgi:hypothetical protein